MKLFVVLSCFVLCQAFATRRKCNGVFINNVYYEKELLVHHTEKPRMFNVNRNTNILYFLTNRFMDGPTGLYSYDLNKKEMKTIDDHTKFYIIAVDQGNSEVYFGDGETLYKYDHVNESTVPFINKTMGSVYFGSELFYTDHFWGSIYTYDNGRSTKYEVNNKEISYFVIDEDGDAFYTDMTGLHYKKKNSGQAVLLKEIQMFLSPFAIDSRGNVYTCDRDGVHVIKQDGIIGLTTILRFGCSGLGFDSQNNMIIGQFGGIYKYVPITDTNDSRLTSCSEQRKVNANYDDVNYANFDDM